MYLKSENGCVRRDFCDYYFADGMHHVAVLVDTIRWFKFDAQGKQISNNPYYTLHFEL